jgi:hypothetical protein
MRAAAAAVSFFLAALVISTGCSRAADSAAAGSAAAEARVDAEANVRASIPAVEAYFADNNGFAGDFADGDASTVGYTGMTVALLRQRYDAGIRDVRIVRADAKTYCVESGSGSGTFHKAGPAAQIEPGHCP